MSSDLVGFVLSNLWSIILVVLFFGGSVLVHELGHFWAARLRGAHVERFSIGFGPKIVSWKGKDGVEYRISWLPLGGYVALPQLADLGALEGEVESDISKLPPITYLSKVIISVAGAFMNMVLALVLGCVVWIVGQPQSAEMSSTVVGYVTPTIELSDGSRVNSPASVAGLQAGDKILSIDGDEVTDWYGLMHTLMTSSGRSVEGKPMSKFLIERQGKQLEITVYPQLTGAEKDRRVGIAPGYELVVHAVAAGSEAEKAGFKAGDVILASGTTRIIQIATYQELLEKNAKTGFPLTVKRGDQTLELSLPAAKETKALHGFTFTTGFSIIHVNPLSQVRDNVTTTFKTLGSLVNPGSDIGLSKMAGPVGIVRILHSAATAGLIPILSFTILVNVSLAIFNLLPIPVLDGGHILFATIAKLRGRALPINLVASTQGIFMVLLLGMIMYVSFFDVRRWVRDLRTEKPAQTAPAASGTK